MTPDKRLPDRLTKLERVVMVELISAFRIIEARDSDVAQRKVDGFRDPVYGVRRDHVFVVAEYLKHLCDDLDAPHSTTRPVILESLRRERDTDLDGALRLIAVAASELDDGPARMALVDAQVFITDVYDKIYDSVLPTEEENILARIINGQKGGMSILSNYMSTPAAVEHGQGPESDETYAQIRLGVDGTEYILSLREADE